MSNLEFLTLDGFISVNKGFIHKLDFCEAGLLGELISEHNYWQSNNKLSEDGYFYSSVDNIYKNTGFKKDKQIKIMNNLIKLNMISTKRAGSNGIRYIRINEEIINKVFFMTLEEFKKYKDEIYINSEIPNSEIPNTSNREIRKPVFVDPETNNNNINNNKINNNKITSSTNSSKQNPFDKTLKEIQKEEKEIKKAIKNKTELLEKVSLDEITTETMSDINNSEVQKNREVALERAAQRQASASIAKLNNVKKARLKRAQELFTETDIINLLDKFIDGYQYSKNVMPKEAWELILERLLNIPENKRVDAIKDSIEKNYRSIYYNEPYKKSDFDNTRGHVVDKKALHEMTSEEKEEFEQKLARNADGSFMVF